MKRTIIVEKFDPKPAERTQRLEKVDVHAQYDGMPMVSSFRLWYQHMLWNHGENLSHPKTGAPTVSQKWGESLFHVNRGKWMTHCKLRLSFESFRRRIVRAEIHFRNEPISKAYIDPTKSKICWLLEESDRVLPALVESISLMSWEPLNKAGLMENTTTGSPDEGWRVWSKAAVAAR